MTDTQPDRLDTALQTLDALEGRLGAVMGSQGPIPRDPNTRDLIDALRAVIAEVRELRGRPTVDPDTLGPDGYYLSAEDNV